MHELLNYPKASILIAIALLSCGWLFYFIKNSLSPENEEFRKINLTYSIYSLLIIFWILCNSFFQSSWLLNYDEKNAVIVAKAANIFSYLAYVTIFKFTSQLNIDEDRNIKKKQSILVSLITIYMIYINIFGNSVIKDVIINYSTGDFYIEFGKLILPFFSTAFIFALLSLINLYHLSKSKNKLIRVKSIYMIIGMLTFMTSTIAFHVIVPYLFHSFLLSWIPSTLSIIELVLMGYASISHRFYSWKYLSYILISFSISIISFTLPIIFIKDYISLKKDITVLLIWTLLYGIAWNRIWNYITKYVSLLIYKQRYTPIHEINSLANGSKFSITEAMLRLSSLLNIDLNYILISDIKNNNIYDSYFIENKSIVILDELEYKIKNRNDHQLDSIFNYMSCNNMAMIIPLYDYNKDINRLFITPKKEDGTLYSVEEITAIEKLLKMTQGYIYNEFYVKKSQAIANSIAHEMRNPLAQIQLHLEKIDDILIRKSINSIGTSEIEYAKKAIEHSNQLVDIVLQEVRRPVKDTQSMSNYSAKRTIIKTIDEYKNSSNDIVNRINIRAINDFIVNIDFNLFKFVIFNILRNALYYFDDNPDNNIQITLESDIEYNLIHIKDFGPGIEPHILLHIFDEYFTYKKKGGTGLGLSYCRHVMKLFNGNIQCQSIYGQYTIFTLFFPKVLSTEQIQSSIDEQNNLMRRRDFFEIKVLVTDDNRSQRLLISIYLKQLGIHVYETQNGQQAIDFLNKNSVDLILMDIQMPVMDGFTASRIIKEKFPTLPIIALSGESSESEISKMSQLMDDRLNKPTTKDQLADVISRWI